MCNCGFLREKENISRPCCLLHGQDGALLLQTENVSFSVRAKVSADPEAGGSACRCQTPTPFIPARACLKAFLTAEHLAAAELALGFGRSSVTFIVRKRKGSVYTSLQTQRRILNLRY